MDTAFGSCRTTTRVSIMYGYYTFDNSMGWISRELLPNSCRRLISWLFRRNVNQHGKLPTSFDKLE